MYKIFNNKTNEYILRIIVPVLIIIFSIYIEDFCNVNNTINNIIVSLLEMSIVFLSYISLYNSCKDILQKIFIYDYIETKTKDYIDLKVKKNKDKELLECITLNNFKYTKKQKRQINFFNGTIIFLFILLVFSLFFKKNLLKDSTLNNSIFISSTLYAFTCLFTIIANIQNECHLQKIKKICNKYEISKK